MSDDPSHGRAPWREKIRVIIFEADTPAGKIFDVGLLIAILLSVAAVAAESVPRLREERGTELRLAEWTFTILFTIEYVLRLISIDRPWRYARSFFGIVDLFAILPTYLSLLLPGAQSLVVIRGLRLLRVFRIFKLARFLGEATMLRRAMLASRHKVVVFFSLIAILVTILGSLMYLIEGEENGFNSIPTGVYWAIVTLTTVGYGDISPQTPIGRFLAACVMILGYCIIAVPTGIVTAEIVEQAVSPRRAVNTRSCPDCGAEGHEVDARYCKDCSAELVPRSS